MAELGRVTHAVNGATFEQMLKEEVHGWCAMAVGTWSHEGHGRVRKMANTISFTISKTCHLTLNCVGNVF
jgi:hypothetical protein